jgi:hypothetical protein
MPAVVHGISLSFRTQDPSVAPKRLCQKKFQRRSLRMTSIVGIRALLTGKSNIPVRARVTMTGCASPLYKVPRPE